MSAQNLVKLLEKKINDPRVKFIPFDISDVPVEERVRLKCMIPPCPNYGQSRVCPPNTPDLDFVRKALAQYEGGALVVYSIPYNEEARSEIEQSKPQNELMEIIYECEKLACSEINHLAFGLTVGGCKLCEECAPLDQPCKHPLKARPGVTGFGIDITTLARKLGVNIQWPIKDEINFLSLIFI